VYSTFGYNSGKNIGKKVFNPELGKVLEEEFPGQLKVVEDMMGDSPSVFTSKMANLENKLPPVLTKKLRQYYLESKIKGSVVNSGKTGDAPRMDPDRFEESMKGILDTADGRKMVVENYGEETLRTLVEIRGLNKDMGKAAADGTVPEAAASMWPTDMYGAVKSLLTRRISDYMYTRRMLKGYNEKVKGDLQDDLIEHLAFRTGGAGIGATVAPEGEEVEGAAIGGYLGKSTSLAKFLMQSKAGKFMIDKMRK